MATNPRGRVRFRLSSVALSCPETTGSYSIVDRDERLDFVRRAITTVLLNLLIIGAGSSSVFADVIGKTVTWTANPSKIVQGVAAEIILAAPAAVCGTSAGQLNDTFLDNPTVKPVASAQAGFSVAVGAIKHSGNCEITVDLTPGGNALTGPMRLTLSAANAASAGASQDIGYATITVISRKLARSLTAWHHKSTLIILFCPTKPHMTIAPSKSARGKHGDMPNWK